MNWPSAVSRRGWSRPMRRSFPICLRSPRPVRQSRPDRRQLLLGCAMALACAIASPASAQSQSPTLSELAAYDGPDRTQRLLAGAKKEGVVNIYSSITVDDMKIISGGFEKKYGIKLQAWRASSEDILQRVL